MLEVSDRIYSTVTACDVYRQHMCGNFLPGLTVVYLASSYEIVLTRGLLYLPIRPSSATMTALHDWVY